MSKQQELNNAGGSLVLNYDRSLNVAAADIWAPSAIDAINTANLWDLRSYKDGDFQAAIMYETGGWSLRARTTGAWGTVLGVTFSGGLLTNSSPKLEIFKDGSTYIVVAVYYDTSRNLRAMLWTASGTTLTNIVDGSGAAGQIVGSGSVASGSKANLDVQRFIGSNTRAIVQYTNNSNYNAAIGITVSATAVAEDASPVTIKSSITPNEANCYLSIHPTKSNAAIAFFRVNASVDFYKSFITDSGTSLSVSSEVSGFNNYDSGDSIVLSAANESAFLAVVGNFTLHTAKINSATGNFSDTISDLRNDNGFLPFVGGNNGITESIRTRTAPLGTVDGDSTHWFALPLDSDTGFIYAGFVGIDTTKEADEFTVIARKLAVASEAGDVSVRFAALSSTSFIAAWVEQTLDKYVFEIVNF